MGEYADWAGAQCQWTSDGTELTLQLHHTMPERYYLTADRDVGQRVEQLLPDAWVDVNETRVLIRSDRMFDLEPEQIRNAVEGGISAAVARVKAALAWEAGEGQAWLDNLIALGTGEALPEQAKSAPAK